MTVLFADLKGSMALLADRDPEEARALLEPVIERMIEAVHAYEGTVNQVMGDGIMALFGAPLAHEDHAVRGCYAALRMQDAIHEYAPRVSSKWEATVAIRVGINSGEVVVGAIGSDLRMEYTAVGQTTHLAARMEQLAPAGHTLITAATLALAEGYVAVTGRERTAIKGLSELIEVYELIGIGSARTRIQASAARGLTKFVGRAGELTQMSAALEAARAGQGQMLALVGEPGLGKSRLVWEFIQSQRGQRLLILESGSVSYGKASAWRPVIDLLRTYFQVTESDDGRGVRKRVAAKLRALDRQLEALLSPVLFLLDVPLEDASWERLEPAQRRMHILDACKRILLREAREQPLLLVIEDLHWIDSETQALLDALVESLPTVHVLMLVNYRPEYQHRWGGKTYYTQIRVDPLAPESAEELLDALLGSGGELDAIKDLLIQRTARNPFFLEESVRTLVETGVLDGARGAYRVVKPIGDVEVPATVQAMLAARIDRLPSDDKRLLQIASVIGKDVPFALLLEIAGLSSDALRSELNDLQAAEFIYEASLYPDLEYTFKHALTHDVAYGSLLQDRRRATHAQILEVMEGLYADRIFEQLEQLAHHAFRGEAWDKAVDYLRRAGLKAFNRSANREAAMRFGQALDALSHLPHTRENMEQAMDLRLTLRPCLVPLGELHRTLEICQEPKPLVNALGDRPRESLIEGFASAVLANIGQLDDALARALQAVALAESAW